MIGGIITGNKKLKYLEKTLPHRHFMYRKCHIDCPKTAQASAMKSLSYGTALLRPWVGEVKGMDII
jgi:hypothetical protein